MVMEVIKEEIITSSEAKRIMNERSKEKGLAYEQKICLEYLQKIPVLPKAKAEKLAEELAQLKLLNKKQIINMIDIIPDTEEELNILFSKEKFKKDEIKKIIEIMKMYKIEK
ncbi:MAG: hypothetical protein QXQ40_01030 [Candidatus Aenigmatarchaeota archaeon]